MEVNVWSNHVAGNLLFSGVVLTADLPSLYNLALCCFPHLCKQGMLLPNLPCPERKTLLKCLSGTGMSLHQTRTPRLRGATFFFCALMIGED